MHRRLPERGLRQRLATIVAAASEAAERVIVPTISRGLGHFPGSGPVLRRRIGEANAILADSGVLVITGDDLTGPRLLQADRIHPTVDGQLLLADRAAAAIGVDPPPSTLRDGPVPAPSRWRYHRIAAEQTPRRLAKRILGRASYR